jgi:hypothetical protein
VLGSGSHTPSNGVPRRRRIHIDAGRTQSSRRERARVRRKGSFLIRRDSLENESDARERRSALAPRGGCWMRRGWRIGES